eukprot:TRINITY_DN1714_c0_g2_i1.p1 TRINITY_DN1714_c0_g2~~TRINITY_DN1714_c0_g2_i1.p1  ORF type:complete len:199 (-),score=47.12 TRINITY_DN1714_c0_g2_i1:23-619(-)
MPPVAARRQDADVSQMTKRGIEGVDPAFVSESREKRIAARLNQRANELNLLLQQPNLPSVQLLKAKIEEKTLRLLEVQRRVRRDVSDNLRYTISVAAVNESLSVRKRKRETKASERFEAQQRLTMEENSKKKHREFLGAIINHSKQLKEYHLANAVKMKKLNRAILTYHANKEKKEQDKRKHDEKERNRMLPENNEEE